METVIEGITIYAVAVVTFALALYVMNGVTK
jgi:hypothetical protein